jgi:hypothetical protein
LKDIPPVAWIIGIFLILAVGTYFYSRAGGSNLPPPFISWSHLEGLRENVQYRRFTLDAKTSKERIVPPYKITVERITDQPVRDKFVARYILRIRPESPLSIEKTWVGKGVDFGLIDVKPTEVFGDVRLVSLRNLETTE